MQPVPRPELTVRAILTGMALGVLLTPCNVCSGLKIGWSFNMSITAGLLAFGMWRLGERTVGTARWGLHENNINQTTASSAASIISGGLVAPIPAFCAALVLVRAVQVALFDIGITEVVFAVLLSYGLAMVAARVSGETGITPIGAIGNITQVCFGAVTPGNVTSNLMAANVTGGTMRRHAA